MTGTEIAQMLLNHDGYIVMASNDDHQIGEIIKDDLDLEQSSGTPGPFVVIGIGSPEDAERQRNLIPQRYRWPKGAWDRKTKFYRVTAE